MTTSTSRLHRINALRAGGCCLVLVFAFTCCRPTHSSNSDLRATTDELGRSIFVSPVPSRIISLAPSITEMLFALGLDDKIVGVTSYCNYPPEALAKEKVGDTLRPSIEKIVALKPDVVVASTASQLEQFVQKLESIGIPVYVSNPRNVDEVLVSVQKLADLMNVKERGDDVVRQMRSRIDSLEARLAGASRPRVLLVLGSSPLITAGGGTFLDDLVTRAGGRSVSAQVTGDYPQFSLETAAASDPEVILMQSGESQPPSRLSQTSAVRNGRVCHIDDDVLLRPGPRVVLAIEQLFSCIHPELK